MSLIASMTTLAMMSPPGGAKGQGGGDSLQMLGFMVIVFALFYFMIIRPQTKKEKERKKLIENIKTGDRILFSGGILGTVTNLKEQTFLVKVADNVKIEVARGAVVKVLGKDEQVGEVEKGA